MCGRAGCITAKNGGSWFGQYPFETFKMHVKCATIAFWQFIFAFLHASAVVTTNDGTMDKVRKTPSWPRSWANSSLL